MTYILRKLTSLVANMIFATNPGYKLLPQGAWSDTLSQSKL